MVVYTPDPMTALPLLTGKALWAYLHQRPPMLLVDALWQVDATQAQTSLTITTNTLFVQHGQFQAPGLLEHIAQTAAVRAGWMARQAQQAPPMGYVAAIKNATIHHLPIVGDTLNTKILRNYQTDSFLLFQGFVYVKGQLMAESDFTIVFAPKDT